MKQALIDADAATPVEPIAPDPDPKEDKQDPDDGPRRPSRTGRRPRADGLPEGCPIEPLGRDGDISFYLDQQRQIRALDPRKHDKKYIYNLLGEESGDADVLWPRWSYDKALETFDIVGMDADEAARQLMRAASAKGIWNPLKVVRGAGGWQDDDGNLILHCGDAVLANGEWIEPGVLGGKVYPGAPKIPRPADGAEPAGGVGRELLGLLESWKWARSKVDPYLLLGWLASAPVGGALPWRSIVWITGDRGTGKSTLQDELIEPLFDEALVHVSEATAAGIWQELGFATLPVAIDEAEPEDKRKMNQIVSLARRATSGGLVLRGGADHKSHKFVARSAFLFSSILVPPLAPADRSRMAILELDTQPNDAQKPDLQAAKIRELGRRVRRRMLDQWPRFKETFDAFRSQLAVHGKHSGRGADQFGILLACADMLLNDQPPDADTLEEWAKRLHSDVIAETADDEPGWQRCLNHLMGSKADNYRQGDRVTIGEAVGVELRPEQSDPVIELKDARKMLARVGIKVVKDPNRSFHWLIVANAHPGLSPVFHEDTVWHGGVWTQELRRMVVTINGEVVKAYRSQSSMHFAGVGARATYCPLDPEAWKDWIRPDAPDAGDDDQGEEGAPCS